jgi:hypothetical protein
MHLGMQDDPIGRKLIGLALADMARLPHLINTKSSFYIVVKDLAGTTPTLN